MKYDIRRRWVSRNMVQPEINCWKPAVEFPLSTIALIKHLCLGADGGTLKKLHLTFKYQGKVHRHAEF